MPPVTDKYSGTSFTLFFLLWQEMKLTHNCVYLTLTLMSSPWIQLQYKKYNITQHTTHDCPLLVKDSNWCLCALLLFLLSL